MPPAVKAPREPLTCWAGKKETAIAASSVDNFVSVLGHAQLSTESRRAAEDEFDESGIWREDDASSCSKQEGRAMAAQHREQGNARSVDNRSFQRASGQQSAPRSPRMHPEATRNTSMERSYANTYMHDDDEQPPDPRERFSDKTPSSSRKASQEW
jgi:hypothetical protein